MDAFWQSTFLITVAEMGDKSQLAALAFATRFSARLTLAGIAAATLLVHLFSVIVGEAMGLALPTFWIRVVAGLAFLVFGAWTLRGDSYEDDAPRQGANFGAFLTVATTFFLAELGDKTMLATITLGSQRGCLAIVLSKQAEGLGQDPETKAEEDQRRADLDGTIRQALAEHLSGHDCHRVGSHHPQG
jgi:putative Ca2+/H+ antiporter (TMEM165/GDT1 family)